MRGYLIFAHNNEAVNYGLLAVCCALMIKRHLRENTVAMVTDAATLRGLKASHGAYLARAIDHIIEVAPPSAKNVRRFTDGGDYHDLSWHNTTRATAYALTPFDETVLLDSDYLVQSRVLDHVWGSPDDLMMNREMRLLDHSEPRWTDRRLDRLGIALYWATVFYFRKGARAELLFDLVQQIGERYKAYQMVYQFFGETYRNDFAFSIALHMLSGAIEDNDEVIKPLPMTPMLASFGSDEVLDIRDGAIQFCCKVGNNIDRLCHLVGVDVHVMNKFSLLRRADQILSIYG